MKTRFVTRWLTLSLVAAFALGGCGTNDGGKGNPDHGDIDELKSDMQRITSPQLGTGELEELVAGNNGFALDLNQKVRDEPGNLFFSPFSISIALAMTYAGARNETAQQIKDTLHFTLGQDGLHSAFNFLDLELADREANPGHDAEDGFKLRVANSIWCQVGEIFVPEFLDTLPLTEVLQEMGMPIAFSTAADFTGIRESGGLMITDVLHKAFVSINEEGTEAAAATAVVVGETSIPETATLTADRPFIPE